MSIEKQGMQALFMQQAWILGSAFFLDMIRTESGIKIGMRDALPSTKQPARWR